MPVVADSAAHKARRLTAPDGRTLAAFRQGVRDGHPLADLLEPAPGVPLETVVERVLLELPGWKVAGSPQLGEALTRRGARPTRHAHMHSRDLRVNPAPAGWADPPLPPGMRLTPLDRHSRELAAMYAAAYPPEHVDWRWTGPPPDYAADLESIVEGGLAGPILPCSRLAVDANGEPAGALIVSQTAEDPPYGGPWVAELFRRPGDAGRGLGRALLQAGTAAATAAGHPTLGLAVTEGNPAQRLYESLGFVRLLSSLTVIVPG